MNWKYILIVIILAAIVGGGIIIYQYYWLVEPPELTQMPEQAPTSTTSTFATPSLIFISNNIDPLSGVRGDILKIDLDRKQIVKEGNIFTVLPPSIKDMAFHAELAQLNQQKGLFTYGFGDGIHLYNLESKSDRLIFKNEYELSDYYFEYPTLSMDGNYVVVYQAFFDPNDERHYRDPVVYRINTNETIPIREIEGNIIGVPAVWSRTLAGVLFIYQANLLESFVIKVTDKSELEVSRILKNTVILSSELKVNCLFDVSILGDISPDEKFIARLCNDDNGRDYLIIQDSVSQKVISYKNIYELTNDSPWRYYDTSENFQWLSNNILGFKSTLYEKQTDYSRTITDRLMIIFVGDDGKLGKIEYLGF